MVEEWACYPRRVSHAASVDEGVTRIEYDEKAIEDPTPLHKGHSYKIDEKLWRRIIGESGQCRRIANHVMLAKRR